MDDDDVTPETNADSVSTDVAVAVAFDASHSMLIQFDELCKILKKSRAQQKKTRQMDDDES